MAKNTEKRTSSKSPAKKPVRKTSVAPAKRPAAKGPARKSLAKTSSAKKPTAKKPVGKTDVAKKSATKRVPLRIVKKPVVPAKAADVGILSQTDRENALAFAMSIANEMKKSAAKADQQRADAEIRLTRRPTTRTQGKQTVKFPLRDLKEFKKKLLAARMKATSGVDAMRATGFNEADDREADGGDGTNQTLRLQALGQMGNINRTIQQIDEALHRIEDGTYGVCMSCGQLIRKPRLINQPFVLTCMECQSEMERGAK